MGESGVRQPLFGHLRRGGGDNVDLVSRTHRGAHRARLPVDDGPARAVADLSVNAVGDVEDRAPRGHPEHVAPGRQAVHQLLALGLLREGRKMQHELLLFFRDPLNALAPRIQPVRCDALLRKLVHGFGADLHFDWEIEIIDHAVQNRMQALVPVDLGDRDVILELPRDRMERIVQEIENLKALGITLCAQDDAEGEDVAQVQGTLV